MAKIQAIRGMNDILPNEISNWQYLENALKKILNKYCFSEIRLPIVEKTELFHRGIGESSDIVGKETYHFDDRNGDSICLRPEGTAGCVRAGIQNSMFQDQTQKLWYQGAMFRHERPQKGRYRQFYQLGVEVFGISGMAIEYEIISMTWMFWEKLGLSNCVTLEINSLASNQERENYKIALVEYFTENLDILDDDSKIRLTKNPLRILDSKNPAMKKLIANSPKISDFYYEKTTHDFNLLIKSLQNIGIKVIVNENLVRGIDYYSYTVFEWTTDKLGSQSAICAGGRYNDLVENLGGKSTDAFGFAMGLERVLLLLESENLLPKKTNDCKVIIITNTESALWYGLNLSYEIRDKFDFNVEVNTQEKSIKSQFKKANKLQADIALIIAEEEIENNFITVKFLLEDTQQITVNKKELFELLAKL